jgi:predicted exporter
MASAHRVPAASAAPDRLVQLRWITVGQVARYLGAAALVGVGVAHIWQYYVDSYSVIPTIGTLFALNFASALVVALGLVAPLQRLSRRWRRALLTLLAASGVGIAVGSFAGLEVSETTGLFGFMESGYRGAIVLSIALEGATVFFLTAFLVAGWRSRPPEPGHASR